MGEKRAGLLTFGRFTLDTANCLLLCDGEQIDLHPKAFDTLMLLVTHRSEVLSKDAMMKALWPDTFVEESSLSQNIYVLRKILNQHEDGSEYIKTIPKRGYQFVADVRETQESSAADNSSAAAEPTGLTPEVDRLQGGVEVRRSRTLILAASVVAIIAVAVGAYWATSIKRQTVTGRTVRSIAVLPFRPLAVEARDEAVEVGMADALIINLSAAHDIDVRPINAVRRFTSVDQDAVAAGKQLGVDAVLDGSIQRVAGRVRITVRLISVDDSRQLWADKYDGEFTNIFTMQDTISEQVARSLSLRLSTERQRRLAKRPTEDTEAYQLYLKGRYFWNKRTEDGLKRGIEYFRQAIAVDPAYALAYAGLADSNAVLSGYSSVPPRESLPEARQAALRALKIDETVAEAHTALAFVKEEFDWDWSGAESEYRRAIDLDPGYAEAHHRYGMFLCWMGRFREALTELKRAQHLDSTSLIINADFGLAFYFARRYGEAIDQLRKTIELEPNFVRSHVYLIESYVMQRRFDDAIAEARNLFELSGDFQVMSLLSYSYAAAGRKTEAREALESFAARAGRRSLYPIGLAVTYSLLGDNDKAFDTLETLYEERGNSILRLGVDPKLDGLRPDPRFELLLRRLGLKGQGGQ